jgi:hypothetical protein
VDRVQQDDAGQVPVLFLKILKLPEPDPRHRIREKKFDKNDRYRKILNTEIEKIVPQVQQRQRGVELAF